MAKMPSEMSGRCSGEQFGTKRSGSYLCNTQIFKGYNRKKAKNAPAFNISKPAFQFFGTDLFAITGVSHNTVLCLLTNLGDDIYNFQQQKVLHPGSDWYQTIKLVEDEF